MAAKYVLDACALTAFICDEDGADMVQAVLEMAENQEAEVYMNKLNFFEVYYNTRRTDGEDCAEGVFEAVINLPFEIINGMTDEVLREAGRIKANYKMSLADSIALGETSVMGASLVTSDHHEFDIVEANEDIIFTWIR